jgi:hypothetical protein
VAWAAGRVELRWCAARENRSTDRRIELIWTDDSWWTTQLLDAMEPPVGRLA